MKYINEVNLRGKTVILRVDYNVPIKGKKILDDYRINKSLKTINYLLDQDCKIILMSHFGKVKDKKDKKKNTLKPVYRKLKKLLSKDIKVSFCRYLMGNKLEEKVKKLKTKEILFLENTRYMDIDDKKESSCDKVLANYWSKLAEVFVMDAFGACHRNHASTTGLVDYLPTCYGFLIQEEISKLDEALNNENKVIILGGAKIEDKLRLIEKLIVNSQKMLIGGMMCSTFLYIEGKKVEKSQVDLLNVQNISNIYKQYTNKIILPVDIKSKDESIKNVDELNETNISDIGPKTIELFKSHISKDDLVVWNGPLGNTDDKKFKEGTYEVLKYLSENNIKTIIAGGDTAEVAHNCNMDFYHISTGGGATLKYLEGTPLETLGGSFEENSI